MGEAMMKVLHSTKKRKMSENKENAPNVEVIELEKEIHCVGATKRKIFHGSDFDFENDSDSGSLPAAYKA
jgi:hypothetical protein